MDLTLPSPEATRRFGEALAGLLRPGDLVLLHGGLGAGKTTLTQGIGQGLGVRGHVASPTFIIARTHRPCQPFRCHVHIGEAGRIGHEGA